MKQQNIFKPFLKFHSVMVLIALIYAGCKEDLPTETQTNRITFTIEDVGFDKGSPTRGSKVTSISNFGVSASVYSSDAVYTSASCGSYFFNESATVGTPTNYYWPTSAYKLTFFAYYPYGNAAFAVQGNGSALGAPTYAYTVPSAIASQQDIMTGQVTRLGGGSAAVSLTMSHRCSAIHFSVTNDRSEAITVNSISIEGVKYTGTLNEETWTLGDAVNSSSNNPFTLACNASLAVGATAVDLTGTTDVFLMLPQTIPAGAKLKVVVNNEEFEAALTGTWMAGKNYNFSVIINNNQIILPVDADTTDWEPDYLKFTALEDDVDFTLSIPSAVNASTLSYVSYSLDNGRTWVRTDNSSSNVTITVTGIDTGESVMWKGSGTRMATSDSNFSIFSSTGEFDASGNIMSLLGGTTMGERCFTHLFEGCSGLKSAPELPATTLSSYCYRKMFRGCTGLTKAPELPATTLSNCCYQTMFENCSNMTTGPDLPALTLSGGCYQYMFKGCSSLNYIKMMATNISASNCLGEWMNGVSSTGTFIKNSSATWTTTGINGVPTGWTVETASE